MLNILKTRWNSETPNFWKVVQKIGLAAGAVGAVLITAPITLPAAFVTIGGYLVTAGSIAAALSQLTVKDFPKKDELVD